MKKRLTWDDLKPILNNTPKEINEFEYTNKMHLLKDIVLVIDDPDQVEFYLSEEGLCCREKGMLH